MSRGAGLQPGDGGADGIADEPLGVLARCQPVRQPHQSDPEHRRPEQAQCGIGVERGRKAPLVDAALDASEQAAPEVGHEGEVLVLAADSRHMAVEKDEREVLGVLLAEFVELPGDRGQVLDRVGRVRPGEVCGTEQPEALLGEGEEDVVF